MEQIIPNLYVGGDVDYEKIEDRKGWKSLRCCKYGPGGHQQTLGYTTLGAPKGPTYLAVQKPDRMALNYIDVNDPHLIPPEMVKDGLRYIHDQLSAGNKVLVACNRGHSRGPTTALLYLRAIGELPGNFIHSERIFRGLYPKYSPGEGARTFAKQHWADFKDILKG